MVPNVTAILPSKQTCLAWRNAQKAAELHGSEALAAFVVIAARIPKRITERLSQIETWAENYSKQKRGVRDARSSDELRRLSEGDKTR